MARIPENEIERLKNEVSVERLIEGSGIELKKTGKDLAGKCPFHEDDTASLVVTPSKNLWHCFGCGAAGGPIDWVIKKNGVSFRHAVELLRDGISTLAAAPVKRTTVRALEAPVAPDVDDQVLLDQVIGYYHETLKTSPEALAYLQARGIASTEAVEHFKLGFADRTLGLRLPQKNRVAGSGIRTRLQKIGIYRESGHEHFNGSLIVPVCDANGNVSEVYGRKITDGLRKGTPPHLYLPGQHRGVWNIEALQANKEIILTEALIDALTFWCAGYRNVTSSYGIEGFTEDHLAAFKQHGTRRVLIAYDRDEAGERGAAKVSELLMAAGIECFRIQFPKGMDANEYALKVAPAQKSLGIVIRKAVWLGKGKPPARPDAEPVTATMPPSPEAAPALASEPSFLAAAPAAQEKSAPPPEPLPASPAPETARELPMEIKDNEVTLTLGEGKDARRYRVRGLAKNLAVDVLKINLLMGCGDAFHIDTLDLYAAKQRATYIAQAAHETGCDERILKGDLGRVLLALEQLQDATIRDTLQAAPEPQMEEAAQQAALALLKSPDLVARILADFAACGLVGEETNKLVGYLAAVSRKLDKPLGVVIQSSSAAGKSSLMDAVLSFVPDEEKVKYSAMTGQSLFYMGETNLKHKALAIVEEEGASRASYALKLLQSEGELTIASTGKDPVSGNLITQQYRVEGPVALLVTTTARDIDEELMNRCLVLSVDEGREQTRAIHQLQRDRRTLEGLIARRDKEALIALHQNAQRLLKPLDVLNPYAKFLTFPDQTTRLRRDHEKYLTLIDTIAFIHQHQRTVKTAQRGEQAIEYIEVTLADIELANRIAHDVLGRSLDELPPQTRRLLKLVDGYAVSECERLKVKRADFHFSRRALREAINWGDTQLKLHLARLSELEYLVTHRSKTNGFEYELVYDMAGADDSLRFPGLADIEALACAYDGARSGSKEAWSGSGRGAVAPRSGGGRVDESPAKPLPIRLADDMPETNSKTHLLRPSAKIASYPQPLPLAAAAVR
ncbi:MAG: DNA primase [Gallionellales bacterium RIFCSPLOWO2_12_FULL_59_22]|nr:MAG: DNA primase [Gallionellales bacterium RIFCSPLOWO2_02_FULL_59_110]OGT13855.1 MAG: DNA primase [Gallionellales bacterium RIFCSPLOWO2_12_FULL_59_22]